ncbi:BREX system P-loop protein BrxC [Salinibacter ruber]|uniref:BREX system P-loop protein BrxC n=1 Tax=Salinibacter ruber TaxID=146919 RepID=UPI002073FA50|nr:BREX system P-loop protein BrxC [Salinibacter ruber]
MENSQAVADHSIQDLFHRDIHRDIEEVIKVDQEEEEIIRNEVDEYIITDAIARHYRRILERYYETMNNPHEGIGIWVSGFFGAGKSSFAKMLGLALENREILGNGAAELLGRRRPDDEKFQVHLSQITEHIPTEAVIFDVSTDRGIKSGSQTLTEIMYGQLLKHLGYAEDLDLAELEITLEGKGELEAFEEEYREVYDQEWDENKDLIALSLGEASTIMHRLYPERFATQDSWREGMQDRADITPGKLGERCKELMDRRRPDKNLVFVIDEVGQFISRDVQKMLDLQAIVQQLGVHGRGRFWLVVTSQEKLTELVGGLDDKRVELARLKDRFPDRLQVHLEPSDISEVTSKRVLAKDSDAQPILREMFNDHRGRLSNQTQVSADIKLPELSTEGFVDLYPLLPYQVDLVIQVVSGLRTQGGASKHVGGANRTIIKLAQQLLIHPDTKLAEEPVGTLARIDQVYDLVSSNIPSEIRGKIDEIEDKVDHAYAQPVAKVICLLQYVKSIHRTDSNIAAMLYPSVDADSKLPQTKEALSELEDAHQVRRGENGYRIPSPAEDDWERQRAALDPRPADVRRIRAEILTNLWKPKPAHTLSETKVFKAGLLFNGREEVKGDIPIHLTLAEAGEEYREQVEEARSRSQAETGDVFWVAPIGDDIERTTTEYYRSKEILSKKEREARTRDETKLVSEEKQRRSRYRSELQNLIQQACLSGTAFFRGNDRSPEPDAQGVKKAAETLLSQTLPEVFDRYEEAAADVREKDLEALTTEENLRGLPEVFSELDLLEERNGTAAFVTESDPLAEVMSTIKNRTDYGDTATGRYLENEFAQEPFGWDFDVVRLFTVSLLRAGKITAVSNGQEIDSAVHVNARSTFTNNNQFRQASFRPKEGLDEEKVIDAYTHYKDVFGQDIQELEEGAVARAIKEAVSDRIGFVREQRSTLTQHNLPGVEVLNAALDQMRAIQDGSTQNAILTFNTAHQKIGDAIKRANDLESKLSKPRLQDLRRARNALHDQWSFLENEDDIEEEVREAAEDLEDLLNRETFFRLFPDIDQATRTIEDAYEERFEEAVESRAETYSAALDRLHQADGWEELSPDQKARVEEPIARYATTEVDSATSIKQLRTDTEAREPRLNQALEELARMANNTPVERVSASRYFAGSIESEEELDAALEGLREECLKKIGEGKRVLIQ